MSPNTPIPSLIQQSKANEDSNGDDLYAKVMGFFVRFRIVIVVLIVVVGMCVAADALNGGGDHKDAAIAHAVKCVLVSVVVAIFGYFASYVMLEKVYFFPFNLARKRSALPSKSILYMLLVALPLIPLLGIGTILWLIALIWAFVAKGADEISEEAKLTNQAEVRFPPKTNISAEISKLADLLHSGQLTQEEYEICKNKIINQ